MNLKMNLKRSIRTRLRMRPAPCLELLRREIICSCSFLRMVDTIADRTFGSGRACFKSFIFENNEIAGGAPEAIWSVRPGSLPETAGTSNQPPITEQKKPIRCYFPLDLTFILPNSFNSGRRRLMIVSCAAPFAATIPPWFCTSAIS